MPTWVDRVRAFLRAEAMPEPEPVEVRLRRLEDQLARLEDRPAALVPAGEEGGPLTRTRTRYRLPAVESVPSKKRREMSLRVPEEYKELVGRIAEAEGRSVNAVIAGLLRDGLEEFLESNPAAGARRLKADDQEDRGEESGGGS